MSFAPTLYVVGLTKFLKETQTKNFDLSFQAIVTILLEYVSHFKGLFWHYGAELMFYQKFQ